MMIRGGAECDPGFSSRFLRYSGMVISRKAWRWGALGGLWALVGASAWLMVIQVILVLFSPFGSWQRPEIARVRVVEVDKDPQSLFTDNVQVIQGGVRRSLTMLKTERAQLKTGDELWILDNYYVTPTRPAQFRLTPGRILLEYPEPLMILALFGIRRLRRAQARERLREAQEDAARPRTLLRDDFHARAERFKTPQDPGRTE